MLPQQEIDSLSSLTFLIFTFLKLYLYLYFIKQTIFTFQKWS